MLQKSEDELTAEEELIYRNRIEPNMDYFIDTMYRIFVEEGRPWTRGGKRCCKTPPP